MSPLNTRPLVHIISLSYGICVASAQLHISLLSLNYLFAPPPFQSLAYLSRLQRERFSNSPQFSSAHEPLSNEPLIGSRFDSSEFFVRLGWVFSGCLMLSSIQWDCSVPLQMASASSMSGICFYSVWSLGKCRKMEEF